MTTANRAREGTADPREMSARQVLRDPLENRVRKESEDLQDHRGSLVRKANLDQKDRSVRWVRSDLQVPKVGVACKDHKDCRVNAGNGVLKDRKAIRVRWVFKANKDRSDRPGFQAH